MAVNGLHVRTGRDRLLIVHDDPERVGDWCLDKIPYVDDWGQFQALGLERNGELIAGCIYNEYNRYGVSCHIASDGSRRWLLKSYLYALFDYPFNKLGVKRLTGYVAAVNADSLRFSYHLGFKLEGTMREALPSGDVHVLGMLRRECRWLRS